MGFWGSVIRPLGGVICGVQIITFPLGYLFKGFWVVVRAGLLGDWDLRGLESNF